MIFLSAMGNVRREHFLGALLSSPPGARVMLRLEKNDALVAENIEGAFESATRNRGLLGRDSLAEDAAMIIAPSNGIHTFFMRFPIDVVFAARDGRVLKVVSALRPWRIAVAWRAFAVIELAAGVAGRRGVRPGERLVVR